MTCLATVVSAKEKLVNCYLSMDADRVRVTARYVIAVSRKFGFGTERCGCKCAMLVAWFVRCLVGCLFFSTVVFVAYQGATYFYNRIEGQTDQTNLRLRTFGLR